MANLCGSMGNYRTNTFDVAVDSTLDILSPIIVAGLISEVYKLHGQLRAPQFVCPWLPSIIRLPTHHLHTSTIADNNVNKACTHTQLSGTWSRLIDQVHTANFGNHNCIITDNTIFSEKWWSVNISNVILSQPRYPLHSSISRKFADKKLGC